MLFLSVRGFLDYAGPDNHSRLARLPCCLPPTRNEVGILIYGLFAAQWPRPPMPLVYASSDTSRCPLQDSRSGWIRYFLSCRALASPTTCRFIPALSGQPVIRDLTRNTCTVRLRSPSSLDELLDKIRNDQSTSAIQMNAVRMETPVIDSGDFVRALAQHQSSESITVE